MRIGHVLTYISSDGAFGGPVAVAAGQTRELARRGHEVHLIAGWDGQIEYEIPDVDVHLLRTQHLPLGRFGGLIAPGLNSKIRSLNLDVLHIHLARDLITAPSAFRTSDTTGLVVQTHGMVMPDLRFKSRIFDSIFMRPILARANTAIALTEVERTGLGVVSNGVAATALLPNGVRVEDMLSPLRSTEDRPQVLFMARLHPRKRVMAFCEMAQILISRGIEATFHIVGPDEGDLPQVVEFIRTHGLADRVVYEGPVTQLEAAGRLRAASVYVLPSVREVFPMTVLEALSVGTAVVLNSDCGIAASLEESSSAVVTAEDPQSLADGVASLLFDEDFYRDTVERGMSAVHRQFDIRSVVNSLEVVYRAAVSAAGERAQC